MPTICVQSLFRGHFRLFSCCPRDSCSLVSEIRVSLWSLDIRVFKCCSFRVQLLFLGLILVFRKGIMDINFIFFQVVFTFIYLFILKQNCNRIFLGFVAGYLQEFQDCVIGSASPEPWLCIYLHYSQTFPRSQKFAVFTRSWIKACRRNKQLIQC